LSKSETYEDKLQMLLNYVEVSEKNSDNLKKEISNLKKENDNEVKIYIEHLTKSNNLKSILETQIKKLNNEKESSNFSRFKNEKHDSIKKDTK
jgi:hypothetical protein